MNINDLLVLLGIVIVTIIGFAQGTLRLLIAIASFYLGLLLASLYYRLVGVFLVQRLDTTPTAAPAIAFGLVLLVSFLILITALIYTFRYAEVPTFLVVPDRFFGAILGFVLGALFMSMYAVLMRFLFIDNNLAGELRYPFLQLYQRSVRTSVVLSFFLTDVLPLLLRTLDPILPDGVNVLFNIR